MSQVLIISDDAVASKMAGPACREWEYAGSLSGHCQVVLAVPNRSDLRPTQFELRRYDTSQRLQQLVNDCDVIVTSGYVLKRHPFLREATVPLVISISHSFVLENLQLFAHEDSAVQWGAFDDNAGVLNDQLLAGDFFICNSERQRDYWLGMLSALGRINPATFSQDPSLRQLIDVVPFGLPDREPQHRRPVLKGVYRTIGPDDKVVFWGGGIYDWLDPLTFIRAMARIVEQRKDVKAFFAGTRHPSPHVTHTGMCRTAMRLSDELGLTDRYVFFNDWIPYEERDNFLLEADVGISLHLDHVETRYAFRTRVLDYIWTGLPMIVTEGDTASELVAEHDLGKVVGYEDVEGVAAAVLELLSVSDLCQQYAPRFAPLAERYRWGRTTAPLVAFCRAPRRAADRQVGRVPTSAPTLPPAERQASSWRRRWARSWHLLREYGWRALWSEIVNLARWWVRSKSKPF